MPPESLQFVFPVQGATNLRELNRMREEAVLTDVTIAADDCREFECHRAVLAASCPYFKAMFSSGLRECYETEVRVHGVDGQTMDLILQFVYTGICILSKRTAARILKAADLIGLLPLRDAAARYLKKCIDTSNCLQIRQIAYEHACDKVLEAANEFSQQRFAEIIQTDQFLNLELASVVQFLSDDDITITREDVVFDGAIRWLQHDSEQRAPFAAIIMDCVRLPFVRPEYLKLQATVDPLIYHSKECVRQVLEARKYQISGEFHCDFDSKQRKPRQCTSKEVLMVFGADSNVQQQVDEVYYYDVATQVWKTVRMDGGMPSCKAFTVAAMQCDIYLTGGTVGDKVSGDVRVFTTYLNKWQTISPLVKARYHHACVAEGGELYVAGGTDGKRCLADVERYCPGADRWQLLAPLVHAVKCPAAAAHNRRLFVFGGFSDTYVISKAVQIYELKCGQWTSVTSSQIDYTCAHAATVHSSIYLLGGSSKVMKIFDPATGNIEIGPEMTQKRNNCSVTVADGKLFVTGGVSEMNAGSSLDSVECFCPVRNRWETLPPMPRTMCRHSSVAARVPLYQRDRRKMQSINLDPKPPDC